MVNPMEQHHRAPRIRFHCDKCGRTLRSAEEFAGQSGTCTCGNSVTVPFPYLNPTADNPLRGLHLAGCRIDHVIGRGSSATVYKGRHLVLDLPVAIKILDHTHAKQDPTAANRFLEEARIVAKLHHPNIVSVINGGEESGRSFIVTRHVVGTSLGRMLRKKERISAKRFCRVFLDACRALQAAHRLSIVHGDVKPDHIIVTPRWRAILIDFGLVDNLRHYEGDHEGKRAIGTPTYMSPEQARGEQAYDFRADIYSLGATMYHALVGRPPFQGSSLVEVLRKHAEEPLERPREVSPLIPRSLSDLVCKAMAKKPEERFQSMSALRRALEKTVPKTEGRE
jgi:eukaryotic-like serine/threonine-protein kinase